MEVPIQLQHITFCTLMSSAVAYLSHFKGCMEVQHWVNSICLYFRPYTYTLDIWGWESYRCLYMLPDHIIEEHWTEDPVACYSQHAMSATI